jgi:hypothetical protein
VQHFGQSKDTIKEIFQQELGPWRFSRRWISYSLSETQKIDRTAMAIDLSNVLHHQVNHSFPRIVTRDEFWFLYLYQSGHMFTISRDEVISREKATIGAQKVMLTIFFNDITLITLNTLPSGARFNQKYFINNILSNIVEARRRIFHRFRRRESFVHMDNSLCYNGRKVTDELDNLKLDRVPHLRYSPYLSPCNFWVFGMLEQKIKDRVFQIVEGIMTAVHRAWDELTLKDIQSVFFN